MVLIIGGEASGKRTYARQMGYSDAEMADGTLDDRPVLYNLQDLVARDVQNAPALLEPLSQKAAVLCNEVGSGVIPLERRERDAREATGRLTIQLAQRAERVVRMVCGIATVIRG